MKQELKQFMAGAALATVPLIGCHAAFAQDTVCDSYESIARSVMTGRQHGVAMSKFVHKIESFDSDQTKTLSLAIVQDAYRAPRFQTASFQQREIDTFGNQVYRLCYAKLNP